MRQSKENFDRSQKLRPAPALNGERERYAMTKAEKLAYIEKCCKELVERGFLVDTGRRRKGKVVYARSELAKTLPQDVIEKMLFTGAGDTH
jgi:hypothetical protein